MGVLNDYYQQNQGKPASDAFSDVLNRVGKYTTGLQSGPYTGTFAPTNTSAGTPGGFAGFLQKAINIGQQTGGIAKQIGGAALGFVKNSAVDIYKSTVGTAETLVRLPVEIIRSPIDEYRVSSLDLKRKQISRDYASGKLSKADYNNQLKELLVNWTNRI